jgi:hypothetical protein
VYVMIAIFGYCVGSHLASGSWRHFEYARLVSTPPRRARKTTAVIAAAFLASSIFPEPVPVAIPWLLLDVRVMVFLVSMGIGAIAQDHIEYRTFLIWEQLHQRHELRSEADDPAAFDREHPYPKSLILTKSLVYGLSFFGLVVAVLVLWWRRVLPPIYD